MLYCPKCQQNYEEGVQRFCPNDNQRLLSAASSEKITRQKGGIFSTALNRLSDEEPDRFSTVPKFSQVQPNTFSRLNLRPATEIFEDETGFEANADFVTLTEVETPKPDVFVPLIEAGEKSDEPGFEMPPVEENTEPLKDWTFDWQNPSAQIGQTIQERYLLEKLNGQDESGFDYLAKDKLNGGRKTLVKIFTKENADDFAHKIYAEERSSLTKIKHPNVGEIIDAGELPFGGSFLATEIVEGLTVKDALAKNNRFDALRAARVVRQAADALGAAHKNSVPHRNLKPENIVLTVDEDGLERIKITNFGAAKEKLNESNLLYKSPEQVEGKFANFTSDEYSLAVIAYQLLTGRLPFNAASVGDLLRAQREGIKLPVSALRADLPASIDDILQRALAFNPFDRYEKVQDFGDEFFGEIFANAPLETEEDVPPLIVEQVKEPEIAPKPPAKKIKILEPLEDEIFEPTVREKAAKDSGVKATNDLAWEKRSTEPPNEPGAGRNLLSVLGVAAALLALFGVWYYFINRPGEPPIVNVPVETTNETAPVAETIQNDAPTPEEIESPPLPRQIQPPPDSLYFQNTREDLKGDLTKNFLGFSLYYPKDWRRNDAPKNFLDVSRNAASGLPVEQMLVTYYNSRGTYKADTDIFPAQVRETNESLKKILPNYQMIGEGKKIINGGWQAYEVRFQGTGKAGGEEITIWGKRLFIPTAIRGMKNGYIVTLLATSLSKDVAGVDDVGIKGELSTVLETFEPNQNF